MFTKYALHTIGWTELAEEANSHTFNPALRSQGFLKFVSDVLGWFEMEADLNAVKLVSVAMPEVSRAPNCDIRIRHHIKLELIAQVGADGKAVADHVGLGDEQRREDYAMENLPYKAMGPGVFELSRADSRVSRYLSLDSESPQEFYGLVQQLAYDMNLAIGHVYVEHDFGLKSAG